MNTYTTLDKVARYLSLGSANEQDNETLVRFMRTASRSVDKYTRRKFYPRRETRFYDYIYPQKIKLDDDLLALDTLKTQNGACTLGSGVLFLGTGKEWNRPPYDRIVVNVSTGSTLNYSATEQRANEITGFWGYHEEYANAWIDTGTSLAGSYAASATSLSLAGAVSTGTGASDANWNAPRISVGDLLRVESEYFNVTGGAGANVAQVIPYSNGTSGNNHPSGTAIFKYLPDQDIEFATLRLTAWLYGQKDEPYTTKTAFVQLGQLSIPQGIATDVKQRLDRFVKRAMVTFPDSED